MQYFAVIGLLQDKQPQVVEYDTGLGYGQNNTAYGAYARLGSESINYNNVHPIFTCPEKTMLIQLAIQIKAMEGLLTQ